MKKILIFGILLFSLKIFAFQIGEKLTFKIKYGLITAGEATLEMDERTYKDTIDCFYIESLAKTNSFFDKIYKVRDKIESYWHKEKLVSYRFEKNLREGSYRQRRIHLYYPEQNLSYYLKYARKQNKFIEKKMDIPENTQDILSAFYWFRMQDLKVGDRITINVTADGFNYPADVIVHRREKIKTIFGKKECFVVEPVLEGEAIFKQTAKIFIWLTADEYKIPVRLQSKIIFGSFKAILKDAENVPLKKK